MQKKILPVVLLGTALVTSACGMTPNDDDMAQNGRNNLNNANFRGTATNNYNGYNGYNGLGMRNGFRYNPNAYDNTLNGSRDLNPNLYAGNPNRVTLNDDADRMADLAAGVNGVDSAKAVIFGGNAYIGVDIDESIPASRADEIQAEVLRVVQRAMPSYDIRVTSDKGFFQRMGLMNRGGYDEDRFTRDIQFLDRNSVNRR